MEKSVLEILHFNDVYDIEERVIQVKTGDSQTQVFAGASRFVTAMEQHGS